MPYIINTQEYWFRTQQRDLYVIQYRVPDENNEDSSEEENDEEDESPFEQTYKQAQKELNAWFDEHLPHTPLNIIGASEYSGWIEGGPCYFSADLDAHGLALFQSDWNEESVWYVEVWPLADWKKRIDAAQLLSFPVRQLQKMQWWDTLKAFCYWVPTPPIVAIAKMDFFPWKMAGGSCNSYSPSYQNIKKNIFLAERFGHFQWMINQKQTFTSNLYGGSLGTARPTPITLGTYNASEKLCVFLKA